MPLDDKVSQLCPRQVAQPARYGCCFPTNIVCVSRCGFYYGAICSIVAKLGYTSQFFILGGVDVSKILPCAISQAYSMGVEGEQLQISYRRSGTSRYMSRRA